MNARHLFGLSAVALAAACSTTTNEGPAANDDAGPVASRADAGRDTDTGQPGPTSDALHASPRCTSGAMRDPNESEGPEMMPGHACIACHEQTIAATGEDAPSFGFGGTAFPSGHEPDDCIGSGSEGARVTVTDATGRTFTATLNHSGNFFVGAELPTFPITAVLEFQGRKRAMTTPQTSGDCNSCHTQEGDDGAPGRITLP